jgi:hypothetical protein
LQTTVLINEILDLAIDGADVHRLARLLRPDHGGNTSKRTENCQPAPRFHSSLLPFIELTAGSADPADAARFALPLHRVLRRRSVGLTRHADEWPTRRRLCPIPVRTIVPARGLRDSRQRAASLQDQLHINSQPQRGIRIRLLLPLGNPRAATE